MLSMISNSEIFLRLFIAALLGGLVGIERERLHWFAGLRTHMLVCVGSALIMIVSQFGFQDVLYRELVVLDPSRVAAQVVSGIGFLGAGAILFWKERIRGLTTAASLWAVAAVGLAVGGGLYLAAISTIFLLLLILAGIRPFEKRFLKERQTKVIQISTSPGTLALTTLQTLLQNAHLNLETLKIQVENIQGREIFNLIFKLTTQANLLATLDEIRKLPGIEKVEMLD